MLLNLYTKVKEYALHFFVSLVVILGIAGFATHLETVRQLNEQIYLISHANGKLVTSLPPKKSIVDRIIDKKVIPPAPVPLHDISKVVEIFPTVQSSSCPVVVVTVLKDGTVVSNSPGITKILVEDYENEFFGRDLMFRGAGLIYPGDKFHGNKVQGDFGVQVSYLRVWRFYPDLTLARHSFGGGISYHQDVWVFKNTYLGAGYAYHFEDGYWGPYADVSVRF
jgi:hypothetical protein